jgi:hypothetical protein
MKPSWLWGISISKSKREEEEGEAGRTRKNRVRYLQTGRQIQTGLLRWWGRGIDILMAKLRMAEQIELSGKEKKVYPRVTHLQTVLYQMIRQEEGKLC